MSHTILHDRIGKPMDKLNGSDGKPVNIQYGCRVNGFPEGKKLDFEYGKDGAGIAYVQVTRRDSAQKSRGRNCWKLEAIANRDAKGLSGFVDFAKAVGIEGHQLAKAIEQHKHGDI